MYLNFNLDNPEDAYFYQYLESQGRTKKAIIKTALRNMMMPQQIMQPSYPMTQMYPVAQMGYPITQMYPAPKPKKEKKAPSKPVEVPAEQRQDPEVLPMKEETEPVPAAQAVSSEPEVMEPVNTQTEPEEVEPWKKILSQKQIEALEAQDLNLSRLNEQQLKVVADELNDDAMEMPGMVRSIYKGAFFITS